MPVTATYPGVYIQEIPSGVRTITGVATSVAAFLGYFSRGPFEEATRVFSRSDFEREFGGLHRKSEASYAIDQFFLNGGGEAWIVRTAKADTAKSAAVKVKDKDGTASLEVRAVSPGAWGDRIRIDIDYGTSEPDRTFNLTVTEVDEDGQAVKTEAHRNLTIEADTANDVVKVIENASSLIRVKRSGTSAKRPAPTGTVSKLLADVAGINANKTMTADISGEHTVAKLGSTPTGVKALASLLQTRIRATHESLAKVTVSVSGTPGKGSFLHVRAGGDDPEATIALTGDLGAAGPDTLEFGTANVQHYRLGGRSKAMQVGAGTSNAPTPGDDGAAPEGDDLQRALSALDKVDLFNILCIPDTVRLDDTSASAVAARATSYCEKQRAFYILDVAQKERVIDTVAEMEAWLDKHSSLRNKNVATYFPRPKVADPLEGFRLRPVPPSGTVAGLFARIDSSRGVWKAPAGIEAGLRGVQGMEYRLTDDENGVLNPLGVNCLRSFRVAGNVCWGGRTLDGADQLASEWKYIPVRRLALFIEESLYRGTQWVVFEPNDEPLWAQIRLNVGAFMHGLFRRGAFQGTKPRDAYLVKCDKETTTQDDINRGIVNIVVGFAPLKPAEFVFIQIQQLAGQVQS